MTNVIQCITFVHMKDQSIIVRVDEETKKKLAKLAEHSKRGLSDFVRLVLMEAIEKKVKI